MNTLAYIPQLFDKSSILMITSGECIIIVGKIAKIYILSSIIM